MKRTFLTLIILLTACIVNANSLFTESFEYANHDGETPIGWDVVNDSWLCGFQEKDHNRKPHDGNWYVYTNGPESWMFMPMYINGDLPHRLSLWAISDGEYQLEIWAGNASSPSAMTRQLINETVSSGSYDKIAAYIDDLSSSYDFLGIHAVQSCSDCILSIDDLNVEFIMQYAFFPSPFQTDTILHSGDNIVFNCKLTNEGYESLTIYMSTHTEYYTDVHFYVNGQMTTQFHIEQDETVPIRGTATLRPDMEPGALAWFDVMFDIDCGCASAMYTYWATVAADGIEENQVKTVIYPNPSAGDVTIEGSGIITIFNSLGQKVFTKEIVEKETITLEKGIYFVKKDDGFTEKLIVE